MAYTKTVWTDRDVEYPNRYKDQNDNQLILTRDEGTVTEAGTLLNSTVMNNIEDGIEALDTRFVRHALTAVPTQSSAGDLTLTGTGITTYPLTVTSSSAGTKLSISGGGIKIGSGVTKVLVSGQAYFYTGTISTDKIVYIYLNTNNQAAVNKYMADQYDHISIPSKLITVAEDDIIYLKVKGAKNDIFKYYDAGTYLTVEVIE
jgi:hypothetical protein